MNKLMRTFILLICTCSACFATPAGSTASVQRALEQLDLGIDLLERRSPEAKATILQSAADLQTLIDEQNLHTPGLYHALGNAYTLADENGYAVLAYRRGEQIDPTDPRLHDSLDAARAQVGISIEPDTEHRVVALLMSWRGHVSRLLLWSIFVCGFVGAWGLFGARVALGAPRWVRTTGTWILITSLIPLVALGAEWALNQGSEQVVIVQANTIARAGPDDSIYDPVYAEPLDAGTEGELLEQRDGWARLGLGDGTEGWVPADTFAMVNPNTHGTPASDTLAPEESPD